MASNTDRAEYMRQYREKNKDKLNAYAKKWNAENKEKRAAYNKKWADEHPEQMREIRRKNSKKYYHNNTEKHIEIQIKSLQARLDRLRESGDADGT